MKIEETLSRLETEIKNLKNSYEQTGAQLPVFTIEADFTTLRNDLTIHNSQTGETYSSIAGGRTIVTFDSEYGSNTIATLEVQIVSESYDYPSTAAPSIKIRRIPYSGGARWIVSNQAQQVTYHFVVESAVPGQLGAKMLWQ